MNEYLYQLSEELRQISGEIATMKAKVLKMGPGPAKEKLRQEIKDKQWQAMFYMDKIENLAKQARERGEP